MGAISGIIGIKTDSAVVERMLKTMVRRGPDETGAYFREGCCLLCRRLALGNIEKGKQPMQLRWAGEIYTLIMDGELYNQEELTEELRKRNHRLTEHSQEEILLHAYCEWGEKCLQMLNGSYAFAVLHGKERKIFAARDRMGGRPFFYRVTGETFHFASEIKTLLAADDHSPQLDAQGVAELILLGPGRIPGSGVLKGIRELRPGWHGSWYKGTWQEAPYWQLRDREHRENFQETAEHVRYLVEDAVKRQLRGPGSVGALLSGGLDSSILSALAAREMQVEQLPTFSLDFTENSRYFTPSGYQPSQDGEYIACMEKMLNARPFHTVLTPEDQIRWLYPAVDARGLPGMADVDASMGEMCRRIRWQVSVVLSGECADEIFGGYPWYQDARLREQEGFPWAQNVDYRIKFLSPEIRGKIDGQEFVRQLYLHTVNSADILPGTAYTDRKIKEMMQLNLQWFMQTLLDRTDRMSMYNGLTVRTPFSDHRIAEYLYAVPWAVKNYEGREKGLLRYSFRDLLPEKVLHRKKCPYPKTYDPHYLNRVQKMLQQTLDDKDPPICRIVSKDALQELLKKDSSVRWYGQLMGHPQTIAYMLQLNYWLALNRVEIV